MNIGFIGAGNMGGALINGLLASGKYSVCVYDRDEAKLNMFSEKGAITFNSLELLSEKSDILILTVKPNIYTEILTKLRKAHYNKKVISVTPGISCEFISSIVPEARVIRTMPNTPALVGEGMTLVSEVDDTDFLSEVVELFECVGRVSVLPEYLLDAGTALSGSSPAMVYRLIDAMANGAVSHGIPKKQAIMIAAQAVLGSAKTVLKSNTHPIELSDAVCSPGGTTIEMVNELEKHGFSHAIISSMNRCVEKGMKMKK